MFWFVFVDFNLVINIPFLGIEHHWIPKNLRKNYLLQNINSISQILSKSNRNNVFEFDPLGIARWYIERRIFAPEIWTILNKNESSWQTIYQRQIPYRFEIICIPWAAYLNLKKVKEICYRYCHEMLDASFKTFHYKMPESMIKCSPFVILRVWVSKLNVWSVLLHQIEYYNIVLYITSEHNGATFICLYQLRS